MRINQLREQRTTAAAAVRSLLANHTGTDWKPEHQTDYDAKMKEIENLDSEVKRLQAAADLGAEQAFDDAAALAAKDALKNAGRRKGAPEPMSARGLFETYLRAGTEGMSQEERTAFRNTMSTTTPSQGGYTVATEVAANVIDYMKAYGGMRSVADEFATEQGNPINYPTSDGRSEVGEIVAQNTAASSLDPSFGVVTLGAYKFGSKIVTVPIELLQDASFDIEAFVNKRCTTRIGRIQNTKFTVGAGSTEPMGVVTAASVGKTGLTGQTGTIIYADIVDMTSSVDPAYRALNNVDWMMSDSALKVIRKIVDGNGRPIFTPSYDAGIAKMAPAELLGYPIIINQDMPVMAANAKSVAFGDFSFYKIRDVMEATMFRFSDSAFMTKGQVGFLMWARADGNLVDVNAVTVYQNSAT